MSDLTVGHSPLQQYRVYYFDDFGYVRQATSSKASDGDWCKAHDVARLEESHAKLCAEAKRLRDLLRIAWRALSDVDLSNFAHGVTAPWGGPDEGEVLHGRFMDQLDQEFEDEQG